MKIYPADFLRHYILGNPKTFKVFPNIADSVKHTLHTNPRFMFFIIILLIMIGIFFLLLILKSTIVNHRCKMLYGVCFVLIFSIYCMERSRRASKLNISPNILVDEVNEKPDKSKKNHLLNAPKQEKESVEKDLASKDINMFDRDINRRKHAYIARIKHLMKEKSEVDENLEIFIKDETTLKNTIDAEIALFQDLYNNEFMDMSNKIKHQLVGLDISLEIFSFQLKELEKEINLSFSILDAKNNNIPKDNVNPKAGSNIKPLKEHSKMLQIDSNVPPVDRVENSDNTPDSSSETGTKPLSSANTFPETPQNEVSDEIGKELPENITSEAVKGNNKKKIESMVSLNPESPVEREILQCYNKEKIISLNNKSSLVKNINRFVSRLDDEQENIRSRKDIIEDHDIYESSRLFVNLSILMFVQSLLSFLILFVFIADFSAIFFLFNFLLSLILIADIFISIDLMFTSQILEKKCFLKNIASCGKNMDLNINEILSEIKHDLQINSTDEGPDKIKAEFKKVEDRYTSLIETYRSHMKNIANNKSKEKIQLFEEMFKKLKFVEKDFDDIMSNKVDKDKFFLCIEKMEAALQRVQFTMNKHDLYEVLDLVVSFTSMKVKFSTENEVFDDVINEFLTDETKSVQEFKKETCKKELKEVCSKGELANELYFVMLFVGLALLGFFCL